MVGAIVRVEADAGPGPAYEVHAGSGYWSQDGRLTVGLPAGARALTIRWPGGREERIPLPARARVVEVGGS
ncbi:MAG: ASPIC/UnbV domain-containing protein [Gemmatimonadales bacterium]